MTSKISYESVSFDHPEMDQDIFSKWSLFQTIVTVIGLIANLITIITLISNGKEFPKTSRILYMHQSVIDSLVCLVSVPMYSQHFMWMSGNSTFDYLLCQVWHGQCIFWILVLISTWNLVFIAFERFLKTNYPFTHLDLLKKHVYAIIIAINVFSIIIMIPTTLQTKYDDETGKCIGKYYYDTFTFKTFMSVYGIFIFFVIYAIPASSFVILYIKIILKLRQRPYALGKVNRQSSNVENAEHQLIRTGIFVTTFFVFSLSWDCWSYVLGRIGIISYEKDTWQSVLGVFLVAFNSCCNPFIYSSTLPIYRRSLMKTLRCKWQENIANDTFA